MTEASRQGDEAISALVDGELSPEEAGQLIDRLSSDPQLRARWARYHASRAALAGNAVRVSPDFADRIGERLRVEPRTVSPFGRRERLAERTAPPVRGWWPGQVATGFAVAAGVAVVALAGLLALRDGVGPMVPGAGQASGAAEVAAPASADRADQVALVVPLLRPDGLARVSVPTLSASAQPVGVDIERFDDYVTTHAVFSAGDLPGLLHSGRLAGHRLDH